MPPHRRRDRGFTLVEILIAIVLVGILSAVVVVGVGNLTSKGSAAACDASADAARAAVVAHLTSTGSSPASFTDMVGSKTLSLASGVSVDASGRRLLGATWQVLMFPGASPTIVCAAGTQVFTLDLIRLPTAAFSTRRLSVTYTGPAIRVRRADNTTSDIGFTATGDLDLTALTTFVGSGDGAVTTWYDQSGNGLHAVQATAAAQPLIVIAGTVQSVNGRPSVTFNGSNTLTSANAAAWTRTGADTTNSLVLRRTGGVGNQGLIGTGSCSFSYVDMASTPSVRVMTWMSTAMRDITGGTNADLTTGLKAIAATATPLSLSLWANGALSSTLSSATPATGPATPVNGLIIGNRSTGCSNGLIGNVSEVITYKDVSLSTTESRALQVDQGTWFGLTIT